MDAKRAVEIAQAESEATRELPLPEGARGERHARSVVQSVRLPAEEFAEIERIAAQAGGAGRGTDPGLGPGRTGRRAWNLATGCDRAPSRGSTAAAPARRRERSGLRRDRSSNLLSST